MTAYSPEAWESFLVASAGASAALAGLLFVGISISIATIAASGRLVRRSLEAFVLLLEVLLVSVLTLVPGIGLTALGLGTLVVAVTCWGIVASGHLQMLRRRAENADAPPYSVALQIAFGQAATVPFVVAAVTVLAEAGGGLYWLAPGVLFAFTAALVDAWVLLVEIKR
jgi:hypothetical protein